MNVAFFNGVETAMPRAARDTGEVDIRLKELKPFPVILFLN